jgi:hypothetical protein
MGRGRFGAHVETRSFAEDGGGLTELGEGLDAILNRLYIDI